MKSEDLIKDIQQGLLKWYSFKPHSTILYVGYETDAYVAMLCGISDQLICTSAAQTASTQWQKTYIGYFDYIIAIEVLECQTAPVDFLYHWKSLLKPDGTLFLGMNNRFGLRYFCGDRDPYTGRNFDGIENYRRAYTKSEDRFLGRCYTQSEIKEFLQNAGWRQWKFYSLISDLKNPNLIYAENYLPNEDLSNRVFPMYNFPDTVFLEEEGLYQDLIENGMFHPMANAWLIECTMEGTLSDVEHVTNSLERGREDALLTIVHQSGTVEKKAAYPEGRKRLEQLYRHGEDLKAHGIAVVDAVLENDSYQMPYITEEVGQLYLKRLLRTDVSRFLQAMDHFRDLILRSSEIEVPDCGDDMGAILKKGYLDMVPLNSFFKDGTFVFYDQEFCEEHYPANVILWRMIATFYAGNLEAQKILPMETLLERYDLKRNLKKWQETEWKFLGKLRKEEELRLYHERYRRNPQTIHANRQRMNFSDTAYARFFVDVFKHADTKKLILFGSGNFAKQFLGMYGKKYQIQAIIDNKKEKWGQEMNGIPICSPDILSELEPDSFKVIICIKSYLSVMKQLEDLHVKDYSVYDTGKVYPREDPVSRIGNRTASGNSNSGDTGFGNANSKNTNSGNTSPEAAKPKKYHIGYVAGVFDLFHVGHVNLLRKAKEQCEYLIVGVVPDEDVYRQKKKYPVIPCEDRVEIIRACRYADQVEALPENYGGIRDAYRMFHFDCQFSGDDHGDNMGWKADREFLEKNGAELVFFPYTEKVSSTKLRWEIVR